MKGDVAPSPDGNGTDDIADWVQIGRFAAGLDTPPAKGSGEFFRADCAPAPNGDGVINVLDWVQSGLFAAGLATPTYIGPSSATRPTGAAIAHAARATTPHTPASCLSLGMGRLVCGGHVTVPIKLTAHGNESALSFTVSFDPKRLHFVGLKADIAGTQFVLNDTKAADGQLGLLVMQPVPKAFPAGKIPVLELTFSAPAGAQVGTTPLTFTDTLVPRIIADTHAAALPSATVNGSITVVAE